MIRIILAAAIAFILGLQPVSAQSTTDPQGIYWVQIEAQPNLAAMNEALRRRGAALQDVNGFELGSGWYGVALGPYPQAEAEQLLRRLRAEGRIPRDSYITEPTDYQRQIWPVGINQLDSTQTGDLADPADSLTTGLNISELSLTDLGQTTEPDSGSDSGSDSAPDFEPIDETPREARANERALDNDQRAALQVALKWAGHYDGRIDAAFGAGTRRSMASWQGANGYEETGVLTTRQRAALLKQYNAVLEGLDITLVSDDRMGIAMELPLGVVELDRYEPPFAHYDQTGDIPARVLLISQKGDQDTLFGLYEIMQTLKIVPETGPRERKSDSFVLIGENATAISHTEVSLQNGQIKGFTLIWPAGDEERRTRVLGLMQSSFTRISGVLDAAAGSGENQSIDLIAGLEIRRPILSRSGFYVDEQGTVVTTSQAVAACGRITIDEEYDATIAAIDEALGIAVLRPEQALVPMDMARFQGDPPRRDAEVTVAGYSYGGVLGAPTLTVGKIADLSGLNGEEQRNRLAIATLDGDAGGPVFDTGGAVMGMLLPADSPARKLPEGVSFALKAEALQALLRQAGLSSQSTAGPGRIAAAELTKLAADMTVLVSCWE